MLIGIDGSRAFMKTRTGIEEYSYQVIKHLKDKLDGHEVIIYLKKDQKIDFELPCSWKAKHIERYRFWTQLGLSWQTRKDKLDGLFIPAHVVPILHPKNSIVTIHGLEYEMVPGAYSAWEKIYMRWSIKSSCRWAKKIIVVSQNTLKDLRRLYKVPEEKIKVVYEGYHNELGDRRLEFIPNTRFGLTDTNFLLFVGRLEERKNIIGIIKAFELLKEKYKLPHKLVLAGKQGFGYEKIEEKIEKCLYKEEIVVIGYVDEEVKWQLMRNASVFLFPSFYEGFGIPVLEAQSVGTPVVSSNVSSIPEVAGKAGLLCEPRDYECLAQNIFLLTQDNRLRDEIIKKGYENVKKFSWDKCASEIAQILTEKD